MSKLLRRRMSRRAFNRALALGAGSALLGSARYSYAQAQAPKRVCIFIEGNGIHSASLTSPAVVSALNANGGAVDLSTPEIFNRGYGHSDMFTVTNANLASAPVLSHLAPQFSGDVSLVEKAQVILGLSSKVARGGHSSYFSALSCSQSSSSTPSSATIDHVLGRIEAVRGLAPFDVVRFGIDSNTNSPFNYTTCATGNQAPTPLICDPVVAYNALFSSVAPSGGNQAFVNQGRLLDHVKADVDAAISRMGQSPQTQYKLEQFGEAAEKLIERHDVISGMQSQLQTVAPDGPSVSPLYQSTRSLDHLEAMVDIATAGFLGGLMNVSVIGSGTGGHFNLLYDRIGLDEIARHDLCHGNFYPELRAITSFHVEMMCKMAKKLETVPEGSGTMLDNTLFVFMSDNGEKHHSNAEEWPILLVGGANMGFTQGDSAHCYPRLGRSNNRQVSNLFNTLAYAVGSPIDTFGNDPFRVAEGPLSFWSA